MKSVNITINKVHSLGELENLVSEENIIICNDVTNSFCTIEIDNNYLFGVAYYNYGIELSYQVDAGHKVMYLNAGDKLICIDYPKSHVAFIEKLNSVIYELIVDSKNNYTVVVCELDIFVYSGIALKWQLGFRDMLKSCVIKDNKYLYIVLETGDSLLLSIKDGRFKR